MTKTLLLSVVLSSFLFPHSIGSAQNRASGIHAIVEMGQGCLIGGVRNMKWVEADTFAKNVKGAQKFSLYKLSGPAGEIATTSIERAGCPDSSWSAKTSSKEKEGIAIASPSWNVMPRMPRAIDLKDTTYVRIVRDVAKSHGIKMPEVKITQAYKIDLDGDGKDEVIIAANRYASGQVVEWAGTSSTSPGDYSFLLIRKIVAGKPQNIIVSEGFYPEGNDGPLARIRKISAIADLNGDGVMEVVFHSGYFEGSESYVIDLKRNKPISLLECVCNI